VCSRQMSVVDCFVKPLHLADWGQLPKVVMVERRRVVLETKCHLAQVVEEQLELMICGNWFLGPSRRCSHHHLDSATSVYHLRVTLLAAVLDLLTLPLLHQTLDRYYFCLYLRLVLAAVLDLRRLVSEQVVHLRLEVLHSGSCPCRGLELIDR
jgi:hypothetical protein